jgi:hypothetical protein
VDTLWTGDGFGNSQQPGAYFERSADERATMEAPPIDASVYTATNALAADALAWYTAYTDDERAGDHVAATLGRLETDRVDDGLVAHTDDAETAGYLTAQAAALRAFATAGQVLDAEYVATATAIADATIDRLQTDSGAFRDGPAEGAGLLDEPLYPLDDNARVADALVDLYYLTDEPRFYDAAETAVEAFAGAADKMGPQVAHYGTAAARVLRRPLVIGVGTETGTDLHRAALRMADHEKVVVPAAETVEEGRAALLTADGARGDAGDPAALAGIVAEYEPTATR